MPKIVDHKKYKQEILSHCFNLFARRGYAALTMRQIASELKISTGSLYHYFPSKQAIFQEMLEWQSVQDVQEAIDMIGPENSLEERLDLIFEFVKQRESQFRNMMFLVVDYYRHHEVQSTDFALKEITKYYRKAILKYAGLGKESILSNHLFSIFVGIIFMRIIDDDMKFEDHALLTKSAITGAFNMGFRAQRSRLKNLKLKSGAPGEEMNFSESEPELETGPDETSAHSSTTPARPKPEEAPE